MKVSIEFDIDVADLNESAIHDLMDDWTFPMRSSRRLQHGSWIIGYNTLEGRK